MVSNMTGRTLSLNGVISKKKKFVANGVLKAELNKYLSKELSEDGYAGLEIREVPTQMEIIILCTRPMGVLGEKGRRIRELTSVIQKRFNFSRNSVMLYAERVNNRGLCSCAQAESLKYKITGGLTVRRACNGVLRYVMEAGARGIEIIVSGKLRGQRAKSMKFISGLMIHSGDPVHEYVDQSTSHVLLRQGVVGIKVKIFLPHDSAGKNGPRQVLPDCITILEPKEEDLIPSLEESKEHAKVASKAPPAEVMAVLPVKEETIEED